MTGHRQSTDRVAPPGECTPDQLAAFQALVLAGGQVRAAGLRERIRRAGWLGLHYEDTTLAAVAALKHPAAGYRDKVFRGAQMTLPTAEFDTEVGWVVTRPEFRGRGVARHLLALLLERADAGNLFATTRADNRPMRRLLKSLGFQRAGRTFVGTEKSHRLQLWVRCRPRVEPGLTHDTSPVG